ncbi:MAG: prepilin-type N-terminal cleavage/methylation domain-containing protein [Halieaceae bacterium]
MRLTRQSGFTLVQLMISMVLGSIVILGASQLYAGIVTSGANARANITLTHQVRTLFFTLSSDLRRSGYWEPDLSTAALWNNPFTSPENDLRTGKLTDSPANSCVLYSYDVTTNGVVDDGSVDPTITDRFGFRLNEASVQSFSGGTFSCDEGDWTTVTGPEIQVSELSFVINQTCLNIQNNTTSSCPCAAGSTCQTLRAVDLEITANWASSPDDEVTIGGSVHIRNDKFELLVD